MYILSAWTGYRKGEIGSLTTQAFDLESDPPTVTVQAAFTKRKRTDTQVLHPDVVQRFQEWLQTKPDLPRNALLFPVSGTGNRRLPRPMVLPVQDSPSGRLRLARPDCATRREMFDFLVAELCSRKPLCSHRIGPAVRALSNQRNDLLAFAAELDKDLAALAAEFQILIETVRDVLNIEALEPENPRSLARRTGAARATRRPVLSAQRGVRRTGSPNGPRQFHRREHQQPAA